MSSTSSAWLCRHMSLRCSGKLWPGLAISLVSYCSKSYTCVCMCQRNSSNLCVFHRTILQWRSKSRKWVSKRIIVNSKKNCWLNRKNSSRMFKLIGKRSNYSRRKDLVLKQKWKRFVYNISDSCSGLILSNISLNVTECLSC